MDEEIDQLSGQKWLEAEFDKIREARRHEILKCLKALYIVITASTMYKKNEEDIDFRSIIDRVEKSLNSEEESAKAFHYFGISSEILSDDWEDYYIKILEMLSVSDYKPPDILRDLYDHILSLYYYYGQHYLRHNYLLGSLKCDSLLFKAISHAKMGIISVIKETKRELTRTKSSTKTVKAKAQKRKDQVINRFMKIKERKEYKGMVLNDIATLVQDDWKSFPPMKKDDKNNWIVDRDLIKIPGLTSIREILLNSEETKGYFKKVGRRWFLKT